MKFEWQKIEKYTRRAKVFGGWIIHSFDSVEDSLSESMVFIPDPKHEWDLEDYV
jgi:hypothetical protein